MSHLGETISDFAQGDSFEIPRVVTIDDIRPAVISKAWFTVKLRLTDSDADAIFQKAITSLLTVQGQIDEDGSTPDADGHLTFLVSAADTASMAAGVRYFYDVKALSSAGSTRILEEGRIYCRAAVTRASS